MGTRHLTVVILKEEPKVAQYGQWDGYPKGQGLTILNFLKESDLKKFKNEILKCQFLSNEEVLDKWNECGANDSEWVGFDVSKKCEEKYPALSRDTGAKVLELIYEGKVHELQNNIAFVNDSLFCEWAYVIDLDKDVLEVYRGFNKFPLNENDRFFDGNKRFHLGKQNKTNHTNKQSDHYYPIKIVKTYSLDNLPSENQFYEDLKEEE
jgi:hypothetical protein